MWWKIGGGFIILAVIGLAIWLYGGARYKQGKADERGAWQEVVAQAERDKLKAFQAGLARVQEAEVQYHETVRDRIVPVTRTIIERSTAYAQTPEGSELCLAPARVELLAQTRSSLFPAATTPATDSGERPLPPDSPGGIAGWINDQGAGGTEHGAR